jgi:RNA polymerase sigma-70 factor (ECF subfamily)
MDETLGLAVRRLKRGHAVEDSAEYLVKNFRSRLIGYFRHHNFSDADAEDLVQETFRRVITGIGGLNDERKFMSWLFQIARNVRLTARAAHIQRQEEALDPEESPEPADPAGDPAAVTIHRQQLERTWNAVEKLPAQQKQCLVMRAAHEMSYQEMAAVLRLSVSTVRNHLREARLNLKRLLGDG